jgi:hypothetical protein
VRDDDGLGDPEVGTSNRALLESRRRLRVNTQARPAFGRQPSGRQEPNEPPFPFPSLDLVLGAHVGEHYASSPADPAASARA